MKTQQYLKDHLPNPYDPKEEMVAAQNFDFLGIKNNFFPNKSFSKSQLNCKFSFLPHNMLLDEDGMRI